jgi:ATP-dependent helicase HrpA
MTNPPAPDLPSGQQDFQRLQLLVDETASTRDSFRLSRQLRELAQQYKRGRDISGGWQRWHAGLLKTQTVTDSRRQAIPAFTYPELPVSARANEIAELISKHQVIVVAGETGSGKTTQIPKICLQAGRGVRGLIGHTQPRRIAARTVATRIAEELKVKIGEAVGYQVRFSDQSSPKSLI